MKKVLLIALLLISGATYAQNVGIGTSNPDESAILDLQTTNKGFLLPRLTEKQKNLIPTPAEGLMIYQTDTNNQGVYLFQSGSWKNIGSGNITTSGTTANAVTAYTPNYLLTSDGSGNAISSGVYVNPTNGNIGIGTTNNTHKLDIVGSVPSGNFNGLKISNITSNLSGVKTTFSMPVFNGADGFVIQETANSIEGYNAFIYQAQQIGYLRFGTGGAIERMRIAANGYVGIGTTNPQYQLDIQNGSSILRTKSTNASLFNTTNFSNEGGYNLSFTIYGGSYASGTAFDVGPNGSALYSNSTFGLGTLGTSPLIFGVNLAERMRVSANGNILIGTKTDDNSNKLQVFGSIKQATVTSAILKADANGKLVAAVAGTDFVVPGSSAFVQGTGTTNYLPKFSATGTVTNSVIAETSTNIGIGTATPAQKLDVVGSIQQSAVKSSVVKVDANGKFVAAVAGTDYVAPGSAAFVQGTGTTNYLSKFSATGTVANSVVAEVSSNIGIGTATPSQKLDVVGSIQQSAVKSSLLGTDANGKLVASLAITEAANSGTENAVKVNSKSTGYLAVGDFGATTPMNIPAGYRLVVQDGIITEKVKVAIRNQTDWADYVFEPTYSLMPLNEVEKFVKENKHLPNVPSADEMVEKGVEVGKTSKMFMEKIEELTLYMIEMKKEIEALKAENAKLRK